MAAVGLIGSGDENEPLFESWVWRSTISGCGPRVGRRAECFCMISRGRGCSVTFLVVRCLFGSVGTTVSTDVSGDDCSMTVGIGSVTKSSA